MIETRSHKSSTAVDEADLHAYVDGCLDASRGAAVLTHLLTHAEDRERVEAYRRQEILLGEIAEAMAVSPPIAEDESVDRALVAALLGQQDRSRRLFVRVTAMAAALALTIGVGAAIWPYLPERRAVAQLEHASPEFTFGAALAFYPDAQPASDGQSSLGWLASHMAGDRKELQIPDLEELGFHAVGGNVLQGTRSPAVHLVWAADEGRQLHLFVGLDAKGKDQAFTLVPEGHLSLHWRRGPLVFALVGAVDHPNLQQTVQMITAGIVREATPGIVNAPLLDPPKQAGGEAGPIQAVGLPPVSAIPAAPAPEGSKKAPASTVTDEITVAPVDMPRPASKPL